MPVTVCEGDRAAPAVPATMPCVIVLDRLRSAFNVGNILRLADATRVEAVWTCGYTPSPPHPKLARTARGCDRTVSVQHAHSAAAALRELRARGYRIHGVETVAGARPVWELRLAFPAAFVFGNEALGISADALAACETFVCLPCYGVKNSINVGNCAAVVLYEALRQWRARPEAAD